ncbi:hypothetical protein BC936DRAFT_141126 [Jimgerdemannia flammicorona]|uniref:Uncharacterized protein n=1 Tax=Jimgerdemannia flammicorona TaxID=994334 RepID=A0A433A2T9_9FUNG|nr:hypothetical protein BC936DRAFT_141126 [Jimgerdemannia flammicorona]
MWKASKRDNVTCVYCRSEWKEESLGKDKGTSEGYIRARTILGVLGTIDIIREATVPVKVKHNKKATRDASQNLPSHNLI